VKRTHTHIQNGPGYLSPAWDSTTDDSVVKEGKLENETQFRKMHKLLSLCLLICESSGLYSSQADVNCEGIVW